jgi:ectoine hydroxylase-related dioxygenase (phytanoyl-CoA dioxygenase family)
MYAALVLVWLKYDLGMTTKLTEQQMAQYERDGYCAVPHFFDGREVQAMLAELERFKREGLGRNVATDGDGKTHSRTKINYQIIPLNDKSDLFRALPYAQKVVALISQLIGDPFVRYLDQIFLKPGKSGAGTSWHTDNAYFKVSDPTKGVGLWIALHDATIANGTMHMIPGVYRQTFAHERDGGSDHHITFQADEDNAVPCELAAGGAILFNFGVPHCTRANTTDKERAGLAYHFLRTDFVPDRVGFGPRKEMIHITGPEASGGLNEYGVKVAGMWETEVEKLT